MAGYTTYCEHEGHAVTRLYRYPFVVRGHNVESKRRPGEAEWVTLSAFETQELADAFLAGSEASYRKGGYMDAFKVENWNA